MNRPHQVWRNTVLLFLMSSQQSPCQPQLQPVSPHTSRLRTPNNAKKTRTYIVSANKSVRNTRTHKHTSSCSCAVTWRMSRGTDHFFDGGHVFFSRVSMTTERHVFREARLVTDSTDEHAFQAVNSFQMDDHDDGC